MVLSVRTNFSGPHRIRKPKWAFAKADWVAWQADCEAALSEALPPQSSPQVLCSQFTSALQRASVRRIPRGARADAKPWALNPELAVAVAERRAARRAIRDDDPASKTRWVEAKRHAAAVERRVSQASFRDFVSTNLNRPNHVGRVSKLLKKWDRETDDEHRDGQAMEDNGRLLIKDTDKAEAFCRTYSQVSRQADQTGMTSHFLDADWSLRFASRQ